MNIEEVIKQLVDIRDQHGSDVEVIGGIYWKGGKFSINSIAYVGVNRGVLYEDVDEHGELLLVREKYAYDDSFPDDTKIAIIEVR